MSGSEDWKKLKEQDIIRCGGIGLLSHYQGNLKSLLESHLLLPKTEGERVDTNGNSNILKDTSIQREFFDYLAKRWNIKKLADWYPMTAERIEAQPGGKVRFLSKISCYYYHHHRYCLLRI